MALEWLETQAGMDPLHLLFVKKWNDTAAKKKNWGGGGGRGIRWGETDTHNILHLFLFLRFWFTTLVKESRQAGSLLSLLVYVLSEGVKAGWESFRSTGLLP